eukprot:scaffold93915_cov38-Attheya_sp.AAC.1
MNTQDETGRAKDYQENDDRKPAPTKADKKEVNTKKASNGKGDKHKMEGEKMIKRGKAVLQQSNDEIIQTLRNKDKAKRKKELKIRTDNEVRSGAHQHVIPISKTGKIEQMNLG